ncbi:ribonuclease T [Mergibacter septicus]|uniref:Ribonuclease T n=1 Tax=Mergibacter septicus TaxID=221402 RepID=A0A8D4J047_9PAST|nr:ribonuclease T [Mergibacter septicus]QDJ14722.1 ribonuclease T [Mergibacter septicus]
MIRENLKQSNGHLAVAEIEIQTEAEQVNYHLLKHRFRGYFPVVIDVETAGVNAQTDALLEIAAITLKMNEQGILEIDQRYHAHIMPFEGANINPESMKINGIELDSPFRQAVHENIALSELFKVIRKEQKKAGCQRSIIVAHNASFDQAFLNSAVERCGLKRNPFHPFSSFDTATLAGFMFGQTVLCKACEMAGLEFDLHQAHSALYDTEKTAELFCLMVNRLKEVGGFLPLFSQNNAKA